MEKLAEGREAEIFRWTQARVVKLYRTAANDRSESEALWTSRVHAIGAPVPECFGVVEVGGRPGVLLQELSGPVMGARFLTGDVEKLGYELGVLHASMHRYSGSGFPDMVKHLRTRASMSGPKHMRSSIRASFKDLPTGTQLIHGDVHPYNVMWDGRRWLVIDWGGAFSGHPSVGVARTLFLLTEAAYLEEVPNDADRRRTADAYLTGYRSISPMPAEIVELWRVPILAARLSVDIEEEREYLLNSISRSVVLG